MKHHLFLIFISSLFVNSLFSNSVKTQTKLSSMLQFLDESVSNQIFINCFFKFWFNKIRFMLKWDLVSNRVNNSINGPGPIPPHGCSKWSPSLQRCLDWTNWNAFFRKFFSSWFIHDLMLVNHHVVHCILIIFFKIRK